MNQPALTTREWSIVSYVAAGAVICAASLYGLVTSSPGAHAEQEGCEHNGHFTSPDWWASHEVFTCGDRVVID